VHLLVHVVIPERRGRVETHPRDAGIMSVQRLDFRKNRPIQPALLTRRRFEPFRPSLQKGINRTQRATGSYLLWLETGGPAPPEIFIGSSVPGADLDGDARGPGGRVGVAVPATRGDLPDRLHPCDPGEALHHSPGSGLAAVVALAGTPVCQPTRAGPLRRSRLRLSKHGPSRRSALAESCFLEKSPRILELPQPLPGAPHGPANAS